MSPYPEDALERWEREQRRLHAEQHDTNDWMRRADGRTGDRFGVIGVLLVCTVAAVFFLAQLVRAVFDISLGAAALAVITAGGALCMFAVLLGSFIREGSR